MFETWFQVSPNSYESNLTVFKIYSSFLMLSEGVCVYEIYNSLKFSLDNLQTTYKMFYH